MSDESSDMTKALDGLLDLSEMLVESAAGHKSRAIAAGFNETAAEQMAVSLHSSLAGLVLTSRLGKK